MSGPASSFKVKSLERYRAVWPALRQNTTSASATLVSSLRSPRSHSRGFKYLKPKDAPSSKSRLLVRQALLWLFPISTPPAFSLLPALNLRTLYPPAFPLPSISRQTPRLILDSGLRTLPRLDTRRVSQALGGYINSNGLDIHPLAVDESEDKGQRNEERVIFNRF